MIPALKLLTFAPEVRTIMLLAGAALLAWHFVDWSQLLYDFINPFLLTPVL